MSTWQLQCDCGQVRLEVRGQPVARAYCHCRDCREFYGLPLLAATAWRREDVHVRQGAQRIYEFKHPTKAMTRAFCRDCGQTVYGSNRLGFVVIRNTLFARETGVMPEALEPQLHLFYRQREVEVDDVLPKYLDGRNGELFQPAR